MTQPAPQQILQAAPLQKTPLHELHLELGARLVPFAGYEMPLHYPLGVLKEHLATRSQAGLFDVSHMGQIEVRPDTGEMAHAMAALERLLPTDLFSLPVGRQRYAFFTNEAGGIIDDLMVAHLPSRFLLIVNAARAIAVEAYLHAHIAGTCSVLLRRDRALLALQGPAAESVLARHIPECIALRFLDVREVSLDGALCWLSRSGYTGEDGFEISIPAESAGSLARALLAHTAVTPVGLGARDSLRLEAGLCLYGADIDETTTPIEAGLAWAIPPSRRPGGARAGSFPGAEILFAQLEQGPRRRRVGLLPHGRAPLRAGAPLFAQEGSEEAVGALTSGGFGPSVNAPVAMGYLPPALAHPGTKVYARLRGRELPVAVAPLPFLPARTRRGGRTAGF